MRASRVLLSALLALSFAQIGYGGNQTDQGQAPEIKQGTMAPYTVTSPGGYIILPPPDIERGQRLDATIYETAPLSPEEIIKTRKLLQKQEDARRVPLVQAKEHRNRAVLASFDPGSRTQEIQLVPGYIGSLTFVDKGGNPWPISDAPAIGNADAFHVSVSQAAGNIVDLAASDTVSATNLRIILNGSRAPIILRLMANGKVHDERVDVMVDGIAPGAEIVSTVSALTVPAAASDTDMLHFIAGSPPPGAVEQTVTGSNRMRAWKLNGQIYIRTIDELLSPPWNGESHGNGGVRVYRLPPTPIVMYIDPQGVVREATIGDN